MSRERGAGDDLGAVVRTVSWMLWLRGETSESFNCLFKATNFRKFVILSKRLSCRRVLKRWLSRC